MASTLKLLLAALVFNLQMVAAPPDVVEHVALCDVVKQPEKFSGHHISVPGIVMGNDTEKLLIIWPECQFGLHLVIPPGNMTRADVQDLIRAVRRGNPGTTANDITRRFTGEFHYAKEGSVYELRVEKVEPNPPYRWPAE